MNNAHEGHFRAMLKFPNRKQMFITTNDGEMQSVPYLYKVLTLPDHQQVLFVYRERYSSSVVTFTVAQLKEFRQKQRNHGKEN